SAAARCADNSDTDWVRVAAGDADSTGEGDGDGVGLGSAAAIQLELRQSKQITAHKILFREVISHHRIDGRGTKASLSRQRPLARGCCVTKAETLTNVLRGSDRFPTRDRRDREKRRAR